MATGTEKAEGVRRLDLVRLNLWVGWAGSILACWVSLFREERGFAVLFSLLAIYGSAAIVAWERRD